jgi:hypothetical protein
LSLYRNNRAATGVYSFVNGDRDSRPPLACRLLIRLASWIVPHPLRRQWRAEWNSHLSNLWILVERGEVSAAVLAQMAWLCRHAFAEAFRLRFGPLQLRRSMQSPGFVLAVFALSFGLTAVSTRGFAHTRQLIHAARHLEPPRPILPNSQHLRYDPRSDAIFGNSAPIAFALATGLILLVSRRRSLHHYNWRYRLFLVAKLAGILLVLPALWLEGGVALRSTLHNEALRIWLGGVFLCLALIAAFSRLVIWAVADQQQRCPVCLRLLSMPVTIGSWSSVLDPVSTELLCAEGHGSLCLAETEISAPDRWTALDHSWNSLFDKAHAGR